MTTTTTAPPVGSIVGDSNTNRGRVLELIDTDADSFGTGRLSWVVRVQKTNKDGSDHASQHTYTLRVYA